jgi:hypothetical protein
VATTDFAFTIAEYHIVIARDDEDTPLARFHIRLCLPSPFGRSRSLFATPWRLSADIKIDGSPVHNKNSDSRLGIPIFHMSVLLLGDDDEPEDLVGLAGPCSAAEGDQGEASGQPASVRTLHIVRFHVVPRAAQDGELVPLNADGTASAWATPRPYEGLSYLPHQHFTFAQHSFSQCGYAIGSVT